MAKTIYQIIPQDEDLLKDFALRYPEVDSQSLLTHLWLRFTASALETGLENFLARFDLSSGRYLLLLVLETAESDDGKKPSELASRLGVTQATVTGLLDGLEKNGIVRRKENVEDGRSCRAVFTEKGRRLMQEARPEFNRWVGHLFSSYEDMEKKQLVNLLGKLVQNLQVLDNTIPD